MKRFSPLSYNLKNLTDESKAKKMYKLYRLFNPMYDAVTALAKDNKKLPPESYKAFAKKMVKIMNETYKSNEVTEIEYVLTDADIIIEFDNIDDKIKNFLESHNLIKLNNKKICPYALYNDFLVDMKTIMEKIKSQIAE